MLPLAITFQLAVQQADIVQGGMHTHTHRKTGFIASVYLSVQVRLCYLSNERLVWLQQHSPSAVPSELLLQGSMLRLQFQDQSHALSGAPVQPRSSYCSALQYGLPGGQEHVDVPVHHIWDLLAAKIRVKVSGMPTRLPPSRHML